MRKRSVNVEKERYWREVMHRFQASGLPFRKFCTQEGISPNSFQAWRKKLRELDAERGIPSTITKGENRPNDWNAKIAEWKRTIELARTHPKGVMDYCRKNNIATQTLYEWTRRIKKTDPSWTPPPPLRGTETQSQMFVPVSIVQPSDDESDAPSLPEMSRSAQQVATPGRLQPIEVRMSSGCVILIPSHVQMWELAAFIKALGGAK